jgi:hypothetical protein
MAAAATRIAASAWSACSSVTCPITRLCRCMAMTAPSTEGVGLYRDRREKTEAPAAPPSGLATARRRHSYDVSTSAATRALVRGRPARHAPRSLLIADNSHVPGDAEGIIIVVLATSYLIWLENT